MAFEDLSTRAVSECAAAEVAAAMTRCFEGYLMPVKVSAESYERRFRAENLDPFVSRLYLDGESPVGILLIARRGWTSRVAAMGVAPEARGQGLGKRIMREEIQDAASRGDRRVVLEVFEQNEPAVNLYQGIGFRVERRLYGYYREGSEEASGPADTLSELDPLDFARVVACEEDADLPWQLSSETLSATTLPVRAFHLDRRAYALVTNLDAETRVLSALVVTRTERRKGWGSRLLKALKASFPGGAWKIPQVVPEELADGFLLKLGWEREPLNQFEMSLDLSSGR